MVFRLKGPSTSYMPHLQTPLSEFTKTRTPRPYSFLSNRNSLWLRVLWTGNSGMKLGKLWALTLLISNAPPASSGQEGSEDTPHPPRLSWALRPADPGAKTQRHTQSVPWGPSSSTQRYHTISSAQKRALGEFFRRYSRELGLWE